jgi:hypothetical protein
MLQQGRILLTVYTEEGFHSRVEGNGKKGKLKDYTYHSKSKVRTSILPEKTVEYFQSNESKPHKYCKEKNEWSRMKPHQRLFYNLQQLTEGKRFEYSIFE